MKQYTTVPMQAIRLELERANLSEELRMLYVALTRAKERVIMTGAVKKPERSLQNAVCEAQDEKLPAYLVRSAGSYLDWLLMAAARHPALSDALSAYGLSCETRDAAVPLAFSVVPVLEDAKTEEKAVEALLPSPDETLMEQLQNALAFTYPDTEKTRIPTKLAISEIAKGDRAKAYRFARRPVFLEESGMTGAQRGNALHKFMQFANYENAARDARTELERLAKMGFLSKEEASSVSLRRLERFFHGPLAARIFASETVYRELRFFAEAGREILGQYTDLVTGDGKTAVQGVADCVFIENGAAVIVDYKSDYVKEPEELIQRYEVQLALYRQLLGESLGVPVKECIIYSFALSREIAL